MSTLALIVAGGHGARFGAARARFAPRPRSQADAARSAAGRQGHARLPGAARPGAARRLCRMGCLHNTRVRDPPFRDQHVPSGRSLRRGLHGADFSWLGTGGSAPEAGALADGRHGGIVRGDSVPDNHHRLGTHRESMSGAPRHHPGRRRRRRPMRRLPKSAAVQISRSCSRAGKSQWFSKESGGGSIGLFGASSAIITISPSTKARMHSRGRLIRQSSRNTLIVS